MDPTITSILIALSALSMAQARCPSPEGLPTKYDETRFLCARMWRIGHVSPSLSCSGAYKDIFNGEDSEYAGSAWEDKVSSLVVRPGCTLMVFEHMNYRGHDEAFTGAHIKLGQLGNENWNNVISSYSCYCEYSNKALTCTPQEEYTVMKVCRNPSPGRMTCGHRVAKGMKLGHSVTNGKSVSYSASVSISATIKGIFGLSLGVSTTTAYDWSKTDSKTFSEVTTTTVSCTVEPGKSIKMMQVVGRCGDTVVYTGYYECREETI